MKKLVLTTILLALGALASGFLTAHFYRPTPLVTFQHR
jgi:hypothetical protein